MDAFYASVEQRDHPELHGKPVIVGGDPQSRGVVAACSYAARAFGIHSAMPSATAYRLCPHAVFMRPRFDVYKSVSREIREIFYAYTDLVEPLSLDEAFLDVTRNKFEMPSATLMARDIRRAIVKKTGGLTASAGVSFNKFLAKVASDINKPNGMTVIPPEKAARFIDSLPVRKFFGVGKVTEEKMKGLGIHTGADLKRYTKYELIQLFGKAGSYYHDIAHGLDERPVKPDRIPKSFGKETTLKEDIDDIDRITEILEALAHKVVRALARDNRQGKTVTLKIKYFDFQSITRSVTLAKPVVDAGEIMTHITRLLGNTEAGKRKVRLLGITISGFGDEEKTGPFKQLPLPFKQGADLF